MESAAMSVGRIHILRVDPGEDLFESVQHFLDQAGVRQAVVLGGYGTLAAYHLHWVTHNRIPSETAFGRGYGGIEILAMNGLVVDGHPTSTWRCRLLTAPLVGTWSRAASPMSCARYSLPRWRARP